MRLFPYMLVGLIFMTAITMAIVAIFHPPALLAFFIGWVAGSIGVIGGAFVAGVDK